MGGWIRRGWILRFRGAPMFRPEVPKPFKMSLLGPLDRKKRNPTTTDPTPHSRSSELLESV